MGWGQEFSRYMLEVLRRRFTASNTDGPVTESTQHPRALFNGSTEDWIPHRYEGSFAARTAEPERLKAEPVERSSFTARHMFYGGERKRRQVILKVFDG